MQSRIRETNVPRLDNFGLDWGGTLYMQWLKKSERKKVLDNNPW
ncbi:hypothetical protein MASR2M64_08540 [Candidatus Cloacimonadota bacterium]